MINCASISHLLPEEFHEVSEGLGLMAQLPMEPGKEHVEKLLQRLRDIKNLMSGNKD
jgi:polyhydroxyalkanoate synthesis regulator phasin